MVDDKAPPLPVQGRHDQRGVRIVRSLVTGPVITAVGMRVGASLISVRDLKVGDMIGDGVTVIRSSF